MKTVILSVDGRYRGIVGHASLIQAAIDDYFAQHKNEQIVNANVTAVDNTSYIITLIVKNIE